MFSRVRKNQLHPEAVKYEGANLPHRLAEGNRGGRQDNNDPSSCAICTQLRQQLLEHLGDDLLNLCVFIHWLFSSFLVHSIRFTR